jgi:hypothetical protein
VRFFSADTAIEEPEAEAFLKEHGWLVHVPPSSAAVGVTLVGVRRCLYGLGTIPHIIYRAGDEHLSLFVLGGVSRRREDVETFGHRSTIWPAGSTTYVLVSDRASAGLSHAARYLMEQMR